MLQPHDLLPHFEVDDLEGRRVPYSSIWQHRNLVLVMVPEADASARHYADRLMVHVRELKSGDTEWIVTQDAVDGLPRPGVAVADRWGEIAHVAGSSRVEDLPAPEDLIAWVGYLQHRCPECEGEAK